MVGVANEFSVPTFAGNDLFAKSVVHWLLKLPMEQITLPPLNLWVAVDGTALEWDDVPPAYVVEGTPGQPSINRIRLTKSDRRIYIALDVLNIPYPIEGFILRSVDSRDTVYTMTFEIDGTLTSSVTNAEGSTPVYGVEVVMGEIIEMSLPLNALPVGISYTITDICVVSGAPLCVTLNSPTLSTQGIEPRGRNLLAGFATARIVASSGLTLRDKVVGGQALAVVESSAFVNVIGRDETGYWAKVWVDGMVGWMDGSLLQYPYDSNTYIERDIMPIVLESSDS